MKKTAILILVLMLGSVTLASAADFTADTEQDIKPIYCVGPFGFLAPTLGLSCGPDRGGDDNALSDRDKKAAVPDGDTTETKLIRRVGGR